MQFGDAADRGSQEFWVRANLESGKNVNFSVKTQGLTSKETKKCIQAILSSNEIHEDKKLTIKTLSGRHITYSIGDETKTCQIGDGEKSWKIQLLSTETAKVKVKRPGWNTVYTRVIRSWPIHTPIIAYLTKAYLAPLVATFEYLRNTPSREARRELDALLDTLTVRDSASFLRLLEHQQDEMQDVDAAVANQLSDAISRAKEVQKAFKWPGLIDTLCEKYANELNDGHTMTLVSGYYGSDGQFSPMLRAFSKEQDALVLHQYSIPREQGVVVAEARYELDRSQLKSFLKEALCMQANPRDAAKLRLNKRQLAAQQRLQKGVSTTISTEMPAAASRPDRRLGELVEIHGGTKTEEKTTQGGRDPWKLASELLKTADSSAIVEAQIQFSIDIINHELTYFSLAINKMPAEMREKVMQDLQVRIASLERHIKQYLGDEAAYEPFLKNGPFSALQSRLQELEKRPVDIKRDVETGFHAKKGTHVAVTVTVMQEDTKSEARATVGVRDLYQSELSALRTAFAENRVQDAKDALSSCQQIANDLVIACRFNEAMMLSDAILTELPTPPIANEANFWNNASLKWDELDRFSDIIADISKCQWESSVKLHRRRLNPNQALSLMNARACLVKIARLKSHIAIEKAATSLKIEQHMVKGRLIKHIEAFQETATPAQFDGLSYDEVISVHFNEFRFDYQPFMDLLRRDSSYRPTGDAQHEKRLAQLEVFFKEDEKSRIPIRLDTRVDPPSEGELSRTKYVVDNDDQYIGELALLSGAYKNPLYKQDQGDLLWSQVKRGGPEEFHLPNEVIDLRRHVIMTEMMLRPEFSAALSFACTPLGVLKAGAWAYATYQKACEQEEDEEKRPQRMAELAYQQLSEVVDGMGRFELQPANYVTSGQKVVQVCSVDRPNNSFTYVPWGLDLPSSVAALLDPQPNNLRNRDLAGNVPENWVETGLGLGKKKGVEASYEAQTLYTEAGLLDICLQTVSGNVIDEYLMRLLNYSTETDQITPQRVVEAFDLIRVRPDLLEDERVRNTLELIFMQPHVMHVMMLKYPTAITSFSHELKGLIEKKVLLDKDQSAGFLMHLGATIANQAKVLQSDSKWYHELYKRLFPGVQLEFNLAVIGELASNTPHFETRYGPEQKTGIMWLRTWSKDLNRDPVASQFRIIERLRDRPDFTTEEAVELINARALLECACYEVGNPAYNIALSAWVDEYFLPNLVKNPRIDDVLNALVAVQPTGKWEQNTTNPYIFKNGSLQINVRTGQVEENGTVLQAQTFRAMVPKSFCQASSLYIKLFGEQPIQAMVTQSDRPDVWLYEFSHEGKTFLIEYNTREQQGEILQKIGDEWHTFIMPVAEGIKDQGGIAHQLCEWGLWVNRKNPARAVLHIADDSYSVFLDKKGRVEKVQAENGKTVVPDADTSLARAFGATHSNHLVFLREPNSKEVSEIRASDIGLTLVKKGDKWIFKGIQDGSVYMTESKMKESVSKQCFEGYNRLKGAFGTDFERLGISAVRENGTVAVVLWPHTLSGVKGRLSVEYGESTIAERKKIPLEITIDQNGTPTSSAAGFCYLAYECLHKKEYSRALFYLKLAEDSRLETSRDQEAFLYVADLIRAMKPESRRAISLQVKAEMLLLKIQRQQLGQYHYNPEQWGPYFSNVQRVCDLYDKLQALGLSENKEMLLSQDECESLKRLSAEGMRFFLDAFRAKQAENESGLREFTLKPISIADIDADFAVVIALFASDPNKDKVSEDALKNPIPLTSEHILKYFSWYFNQIQEGKLTKDDLFFLFRPLEAAKNDEEKMIVQQADKARRLLYQMASQGDLAAVRSIDFKELIKIRASLPTSRGKGIFHAAYTVVRKVAQGKRLENAITEVFEGADAKRMQALVLVPAKQAAHKSQATAALLVPKTDMKAAKAPIAGRRLIDTNALKGGFAKAKQQGLLSKAEQSLFEEIIRNAESGDMEPVELEEFVQATSELHLLDMRREEAVRQEINAISLSDAKARIDMHSHPLTLPSQLNLDEYFEKASDVRENELTAVATEAQALFSTLSASAMDEQENKEMREGIEAAAKNLKAAASKMRAPISDLRKIQEYRDTVLIQERDLRAREMLTWARNEGKAISSINQILEHPELYSEQDLLDELLDIYQSSQANVDAIEATITSYLLLATAVQQVDLYFEKQEFEIIERGLNLSRYQKDGMLDNPQYSRKYLVAELRHGIILREGQLSCIEKLAKNPEQWVSLRMGLGKTSYIMPIVALLLAEEGKLPILLVPTSQREMNLSAFDKTTRKMIGRAGEPLVFSSDSNVSPGYLAGQYLHMLQVKQSSGYLVSTVDSLANIKNLLNVLSDERSVKCAQLQSATDEEKQELLLNLFQIEKRIFWLEKIEVLLDGKVPGVDTIFFGDEVDSLFMISKEMNRAMGKPEKLDETIRTVSHHVFTMILESENAELKVLASQILAGTQADIKPPVLKEKYLVPLAIALTHNSELQTLVPAFKALSDDDRKLFAQYAVGLTETMPPAMASLVDKEKTAVSAIKRILSTTLPSVFSQETDVQFGYSGEDGATIVPREGKSEIAGNRFGEECELVAAQLLGAAQMGLCQATNGASKAFLVTALGTYEERYPDDFSALLKALGKERSASKEAIFTALLEPQFYKERLAIIERLVLDVGFVSRFSEQSTLSVQSTMTGRRCGGVTGTLNPYALPNYHSSETLLTREVEAETILQMAINHPKKLDEKCHTFNEASARAHIEGLLDDKETVAIINEGGYGMKGMTTLDWVKELRSNKKDVSFVFVHPTIRKPFLWRSGESSEPEMIQEGVAYPQRYVCVFGPADCRGTDLKISKGNTHYFPLRTTNLQDMGQAIWRGRKTGDIHTPCWHVPEGMFPDVPTIGEALLRIKENSVERQGQLNLKAQAFRVKEIADDGVRKMLFTPTKEEESSDYWSKENQELVVMDMAAKDLLFQVFRSYMIKSKMTDFSADFAPNKLVKAVDQVRDAYDKEIHTLDAKFDELVDKAAELFFEDVSKEDAKKLVKALISKYSSTIPLKHAFKQAIEELVAEKEQVLCNHVLQQLPDNAKPMIKQDEILEILRSGKSSKDIVNEKMGFMAVMVPPRIISEMDDALKIARSALQELEKVKQDALKKAEGITSSESRVLARLCQGAQQVGKIQAELREAQKNFDPDAHKRFLPEMVSQVSAGASGTQEQVQQQQQQQQQQQEQQAVQKVKKVKPAPETIEKSFIQISASDIESPASSDQFTLFASQIPGVTGLENIYLSKEMQKIYDRLPSLQGDPIGHVCLNKNGQVLLVSKLEYFEAIQPRCASGRISTMSVFTAGPTGCSPIDRVGQDMRVINAATSARVKYLLGFTEFTKEEKVELDKWLASLTSQAKSALKSWCKRA